jgi:hypothetical protein
MLKTMDNEFARYLASYLEQHQDKFIFTSFDRNASHNTGEYKEYTYLDREALERVIVEFQETLP